MPRCRDAEMPRSRDPENAKETGTKCDTGSGDAKQDDKLASDPGAAV
jgi:hypothetical protein